MGKQVFRFVFIDHTGEETPPSLRPSEAKLAKLFAALKEQIRGPFAAEHGTKLVTFRCGTVDDRRGPESPTPEIAVHLRPTIPEAPDALAYHQVVDGIPDIEVGLDLFDSWTEDGESVTAGIDHEILETLLNPGAGGWAEGRDDGTGEMDRPEACDIVQNLWYRSSNGTALSNFITAAFFVPGAAKPFDYLGKMKDRTDFSNGYGMVAAAPTRETQVEGEEKKAEGEMSHPPATLRHHGIDAKGRTVAVRGELTAKQKARKSHPHSRTYRMGIRFG